MVTLFKAAELLEPLNLSHCSESKLFNTFKKVTVEIYIPK